VVAFAFPLTSVDTPASIGLQLTQAFPWLLAEVFPKQEGPAVLEVLLINEFFQLRIEVLQESLSLKGRLV